MSHWAWDPLGWSFNLKFHDFAGSCTVHVSAGLSALIATYFMGPRLGRFTPDGRPREMAGHSVPMAALGGFILLFGFLAFNGGSQGAIASLEDAEIVSNSVVVTIMAGCSGGLVVLFVNKIMIG
jgi:Amt family ammonium transporter